MSKNITRIGIDGPVGSGKTGIVEAITPLLLDLGIKVLIITNDVVTTEDAKHVRRTLKGILLEERILGVETGACPHTAVREDPSMNLAAVEDMEQRFPDTDVVLIESGGDNLTLTFSPALVDFFIYVIDVAAGDKIPRKNGPGITPNWITGVSIGAINAALIAGNRPEDRIPRLREFWDRVSSGIPLAVPAPFDLLRLAFNRWSASASAAFGVPGFFAPRVPPTIFRAQGTAGALSLYDTS